MDRIEREKYKKKMVLYKKLGAEKFQKVVFKVERAKFKILKKICPNFIKYFDKYIDSQKKKALKKVKTEQEAKQIIENSKFVKMAMRKEFYQEKNRNYHMDPKKPTEIYQYLEWNKEIHKRGIIKDAILIPILIGGAAFSVPGAIPLLIAEIVSAGINFECINIQNYNICRYKIMKEALKKREEQSIQKRITEYGEAAEVIHKTMEKTEDLPSIDDIIHNIQNKEQLRQLREMLIKEQQGRESEKDRGNQK